MDDGTDDVGFLFRKKKYRSFLIAQPRHLKPFSCRITPRFDVHGALSQ